MKSPTLQIGSFTFQWGSRTYVMGILNVTPDSFSGDGIIAKGDAVAFAIKQAADFLEGGADILDVGGESTRPGSAPVTADEEMERVIPVIEALHANFPNAIISIDSYKASVAEAAI
ncbi:MAG: dihydropteroate synthase, partial [Anaerolineaceae bacterium]